MRWLIAWRLGLLAVAILMTLPSLANAAPLDWHAEWQGRKEQTLDRLREKPVWTADDVKLVTLIACDDLGVDDAGFVAGFTPRLAFRESTFRCWVVNASGHAGLYQFAEDWAPLEKRIDPVWSTYRIVQVYRDGGLAKIRQHWALTY